MCDACGCGEKESTEDVTITVNKNVREDNDHRAHRLWHHLQHEGVLCVNIMGAPGSGKTTLIEMIAKQLGSERLLVIQGDLESDVDKQRLEKQHVETYQINTHSGCHLNAHMIEEALKHCELEGKEFLFIENVGNLVCPAGVKIGQHMNMVVSATTEGSDKPRKYPHIYRDADVVVISKYDLKDIVSFDEERYREDLGDRSSRKIITTTASEEQGAVELARLLQHRREHVMSHHHEHSSEKQYGPGHN